MAFLFDLIVISFVFYIIVSLMLKLLKLRFTGNSRKNKNETERFDTNNKDISDADYKDIN